MHTAVRERAGLSALLAVTAVLVLAAWCVLVLWVASRVHYGLAACAWALALGALWLDWDRAHGIASGSPGPALVCSAAVLGVTALLAAEPSLGRSGPVSTLKAIQYH